MPNGIKVSEDCYRVGDTITLSSSDYMYGLFYNSLGLMINLPLNKPVYASGFTMTINDTTVTYASNNGAKTVTNPSAHNRTIGNTTLQFSLQGTFSDTPTHLSPVVVGLSSAVITFT